MPGVFAVTPHHNVQVPQSGLLGRCSWLYLESAQEAGQPSSSCPQRCQRHLLYRGPNTCQSICRVMAHFGVQLRVHELHAEPTQ